MLSMLSLTPSMVCRVLSTWSRWSYSMKASVCVLYAGLGSGRHSRHCWPGSWPSRSTCATSDHHRESVLFIGTQFNFISVRPSKQPLVMVRTFLKVYYMELSSSFLFLQEQIKDIISS